MELPEENHTKSPLDWIGDVFTVLMLLPVALIMSILVGGYFILKFPIWYLKQKYRNASKKIQ